MKLHVKLIVAATAITVLSGCEVPTVATRCPPVPTQHVITISEGFWHPFDALPGDRLDILMDPTPDAAGILARCDAYGGVLFQDPARGLWTCQGVDF